MKNLNKRGGKGMHPLGCLPLWEREGVTPWLPQRISEFHIKRGFQQSRFFIKKSSDGDAERFQVQKYLILPDKTGFSTTAGRDFF
jgi:hypothetical protein